MVQSLWKKLWRLLKKLKIELPHDPATLLAVIDSKELKAESRRDISTPVFIAASITIAKGGNTQVSNR